MACRSFGGCHSAAQCSATLLTDGRPHYNVKFEAHADAGTTDGRCLLPKALNTCASTPLYLPCSMVSTAAQHAWAGWKCGHLCHAAVAQHSAGHILLAGLPEACQMASACDEALCTACAHQSPVRTSLSDATPSTAQGSGPWDGKINSYVKAGCSTSLPNCRLCLLWTLMSPSSSPFPQRSSSITLRPSALMRWCCICAITTRWGPSQLQ